MKRRVLGATCLVLLMVGLSGCGTKEPVAEHRPNPNAPQPIPNTGNAPPVVLHAD